MARAVDRPTPGRGLSARILALTVAFVLLGEVLIYVPSIARFRLSFLEERVAGAHLAALSLDVPHPGTLPPELETRLLRHAGVLAITLWRPDAELMLGRVESVDAVFDLRRRTPLSLVLASLGTVVHGEGRMIRVVAGSALEPQTVIDVILDETAMRSAMLDYSWRILLLSLVLSAIVASLLFFGLRRMIVLPLRGITERLAAFRERPEVATDERPPTRRRDEIGVVERELAEMQRGLRRALAEKTRLAALGAAVSKINHDLKSILASAVLVSDRLESSADPAVRSVTPRLVDSLDRAIRLCAETLRFAREQPPELQPRRFALRELVDEVGAAVTSDAPRLAWRNQVDASLDVTADRDQLYRVLLNLGRNSRHALGEQAGEIRVAAGRRGSQVRIEVKDNGPGLPEQVLPHLFESFSGSTKAGGSGLGLAICLEIMRAHGGDIALLDTGHQGTSFELRLPARIPHAAAASGEA
ncbi:HAMP domain-containing sensor histidine kinase [Geminicoccaceae bacterium 1502E]|nr:HAMP domain-containing sensor histidine kinase [Geminicoccaceae bacterium 1502E]